tara:strand:- start:1391 stop:2512 length:1122 start_codon:yes stop_codon:yes gene_type:complete
MQRLTLKMIKVISFNIFLFLSLLIPLEYFSGKLYNDLKGTNGHYAVNELLKQANSPQFIPLDSSKSILPHPYLLYVNNPNYFEKGLKKHNKYGYRNKDFMLAKEPNKYRVLALGGSTTYGFGNPNTFETWVSVLEQKINLEGKKIEIINAGLNYGTSAEILASYIFRHKYLNPDLIIYHGGGNDISPVFFPNYSNEYTHFRSKGNTIALRQSDKLLLSFNFFKLIYCYNLKNINSVYKPQPFSFSNLDPVAVKQRIENDNNYDGFRRNIASLIKYAKINSSKIVLAGFLLPSENQIKNSRPDLKNLSKELIYATKKNNDILKNLAEDNQIKYFDFSNYNFSDSLFIDNCHLNAKGERLKAEAIYKNIITTIDN